MRITVLAGPGRSTNILLNWLDEQGFDDVQAIIEKGISGRTKLRSRFKRLGLRTAFGQLVFQISVPPFLKMFSASRIGHIMNLHGLKDSTPLNSNIIHVDSVNDKKTINLLQERQPKIVIVNGTRIIRKNVLSSINCLFINTHAGITPQYRGVHGGYWALWNGDHRNFGVTVHLVDEGVDTGGVIAQVHANPSAEDNFVTYPVLQQAISFAILSEILADQNMHWLDHHKERDTKMETGRQWYHRTICQYFAGMMRGIK